MRSHRPDHCERAPACGESSSSTCIRCMHPMQSFCNYPGPLARCEKRVEVRNVGLKDNMARCIGSIHGMWEYSKGCMPSGLVTAGSEPADTAPVSNLRAPRLGEHRGNSFDPCDSLGGSVVNLSCLFRCHVPTVLCNMSAHDLFVRLKHTLGSHQSRGR